MKCKITLFNFLLVLFLIGCREGIVEVDNKTTGDLYIHSNPEGAQIWFNYNPTGKTTPDSLIQIQPGNYWITARLLGVGEKTVNVSVVSGQKKYLTLYLESDYAKEID